MGASASLLVDISIASLLLTAHVQSLSSTLNTRYHDKLVATARFQTSIQSSNPLLGVVLERITITLSPSSSPFWLVVLM